MTVMTVPGISLEGANRTFVCVRQCGSSQEAGGGKPGMPVMTDPAISLEGGSGANEQGFTENTGEGNKAGISGEDRRRELISLSAQDERKARKLARREIFKKWEVVRQCSDIIEEGDWLAGIDNEFMKKY